MKTLFLCMMIRSTHGSGKLDSFLPEIDVYIEVCGTESIDYSFRKKVYRDNGICVVFLHYYKTKHK